MTKARLATGFCLRESDLGDVFRLQAFLALDHREFHFLAFHQGAVTLAADGAVVNEHVRTAIALNESITFGVIEPLDGSDLTISPYHTLPLAIFYKWPSQSGKTSTVRLRNAVLVIRPRQNAVGAGISNGVPLATASRSINKRVQLKRTFLAPGGILATPGGTGLSICFRYAWNTSAHALADS